MEAISGKLFEMLKEFGVLSFVIAMLSCLLVQAIKQSDDKVFTKYSLSGVGIWVLNLIITGLITIAVVFVFDGLPSIVHSIVYSLLCWLLSWAMSILGYDYFLKFLFLGFDIIDKKLKKMKGD